MRVYIVHNRYGPATTRESRLLDIYINRDLAEQKIKEEEYPEYFHVESYEVIEKEIK